MAETHRSPERVRTKIVVSPPTELTSNHRKHELIAIILSDDLRFEVRGQRCWGKYPNQARGSDASMKQLHDHRAGGECQDALQQRWASIWIMYYSDCWRITMNIGWCRSESDLMTGDLSARLPNMLPPRHGIFLWQQDPAASSSLHLPPTPSFPILSFTGIAATNILI